LKTYYGLTALMLAIDCENHEIARLLIAHGADVNLRDNTGDSALMFATSRKEAKKSIQIIEMIIKKKADLNLQNNEGNTALMIAIQNQNFQMARILIQNEANVNMVDKNGKNALLYVIQSEETSLSLDVLKMLIKKKADLNLQNNEGNTALMIAIENQNFQMAHILILNGANVNMVDKTALLYVVRYKETCHSIRLLKMMIQKDVDVNLQNKGKTALMIAIENGNDVTANLLLQNGANVDLITERQETAIHYFCSIGKIQSVHFLIKHNANLNIQNSLGKTPLMIALENKNFMISEMLIDYNADLDIFDRNEESFWFYFCAFNSNEFLKNQSSEAILWYFKEYKPKSGKCLIGPNEQRNENLRRYFVDFHKKCLSKLEERNTWFDKPNHEGQTPLLRAIQRKADKWIIELLIRKGANISHVSKRGETALSYAIENNLVDIAELLIKSGANLNLGLGLEPYLYTVCMKRIDSNLCKLLIEHGANLHCRHSRSGTGRVFASLCDWLLSYDSTNRNIYRNALIKELSDTFKYTDYKRFQERVIKSIEDEDVIIVDRNHLEALGIYNKQEKELVEVIEHLKSLEFRERLIADYLNVLEEQKEILETKVLKLDTSLQKSKEPPEKRKKKCQDDFLCDEEVESELDCIESSGLFDEQTKQLEIARRYVQTVKTKLKDGQKLLEFIEKKLLLDQQVY
jgi:ankyrin repeat protein